MVLSQYILETIMEGDEEKGDDELEEEEQVPLQGKTWLARATKLQRRKSGAVTLSSTQVDPLELSLSKDEVHKWVDK